MDAKKTHVKQLTAEPVEHTNVKGKSLYYLKETNNKGEEEFINLGKGTFEKCKKLLNIK